jgi:antitoxin component of MazEF toxin-antitoxin module
MDSSQQNKASVESWTTTLQRWGDGSEDFALSIPLEVQQQLGLTESSVVNVEIVDERLVMSRVQTSQPSNDDAI